MSELIFENNLFEKLKFHLYLCGL